MFNNHELIATNSGGKIMLLQLLCYNAANLAEDLIAPMMAMLVVNQLKLIQIYRSQRLAVGMRWGATG